MNVVGMEFMKWKNPEKPERDLNREQSHSNSTALAAKLSGQYGSSIVNLPEY